MADDETENEPPPITPRPMAIRVLAALAIVAILGLSMFVVLRAGHNIDKTVTANRLKKAAKNTTTTLPHTATVSSYLTIVPAAHLSDAQLRADAVIVERRAQALGYVTDTPVVADGRIRLGTNGPLPRELQQALVGTGSVENRVSEAQLPDTKRCAALVDGTKWFWDTEHKTCYSLGPNLLGGDAVTRASASENPQAGGWGVDVTYRDNLFVQRVATPNLGKQVAILLGGDVVSAPTIEPGITGNDVRISGKFDEIEAKKLAAVLRSGELHDQLVVR